jgi:3-oxoacyl-(acyl-carrier-protein) synthase
MVMNNGLVGLLALTYGFGGPAYCPTSACSTGNDAIGQAFHLIRNGQATAVLAGSADSTVAALGMAGFAQAGALSTRSETTPRPFDKARDGLLTGEGAAIFVLERLGDALARGAPILAEVIGYGITNDGYNMVAPSPGGEGAVRAMNRAIKDAGIRPDEVDYINAHGTGTPLNDLVETRAIKHTLGDHAFKVAVSSSKSMTGHCMGAAGAIEAAICINVLREGIVPPTINHTDPDPECDLDYTPMEPRKRAVRVTMNNSFGFGGQNSVTIFKRYEA